MNKNSIKIRIGENPDNEQVLKMLISHPMETGLRKQYRTGKLVAADYIDRLEVLVDGQLVFEINLGPSASKNPYLTFVFTKYVSNGQQLSINWQDNLGKQVQHDFVTLFDEKGYSRLERISQGPEVDQLTPSSLPTCRSTSSGIRH